MSETIRETVSVAAQSFVEAPVKTVIGAGGVAGGAMVEMTSPLAPYIGWIPDATVVAGFVLLISLVVLNVLKIRSQIRG